MRHHVCFIVPPHILKNLSRNSDAEVRDRAHQSMELTSQARGMRAAIGPMAAMLATSPGTKRRTVYDERNGTKLPGKFLRGEGDKPVTDK